MKRMKKAVSLALCAVMVFALAACGKKEGDTQPEKEVKEYTYVPEYIELEDGENYSLYNAQIAGNSMYFMQYGYDEATETSFQKFCEYSLTEKKLLSEKSLGEEGQSKNINSFRVTEDGSVVYTVENYYNEDYSERKTYICAYDAQGVQTLEKDITSDISDGSEYGVYVDTLVIDGEGRIYLNADSAVHLFDKDGGYSGKITTDTWINSMGTGKDGKVYACYYDNSDEGGRYCIAELDFAGKKMGTIYKNFPSGNSSIIPGINKDFMAYDSVSVYEYDMSTQTSEVLFDWLDSDINGSNVQGISISDDNRVLALISDWNTGAYEIALLNQTKTADLPQKTQIVIGTLYGGDQNLMAAAVNFNKQSNTYHVSIKSYIDPNTIWTETTYSDAITNMNNDFISGSNCPDIIDLSQVNVEQLAAKGVLEDLNGWLDKSSVLKKSDYLENILDSYTYDGVLTGIPYSFYVNTVVGKTSDVGEEIGWTLQEMMDYAKANPGKVLFDYAPKSRILQICMTYNQDSFIDYSTGKCSFDSEEFKNLLEFVSEFPDEYDWNSDDRSTPVKLQAGDVLLDTVYMSSFEDVQLAEAMFNEPVTFVGYPTMDGSAGCMLNTSDAYGISTKSQNKDGAWAFIESYLNKESGRYDWNFPTRKDRLEEMMRKAVEVTYITDENGDPILDEEGNPIPEGGTSGVGYGDWEYTYHKTTQEEAELTMEIIGLAKVGASVEDQIMVIITEEADPFFQGQKSVDDVADVIQRRIQLYINENQ